MESKNCFVIIGYGKKFSYVNGKIRELDLDQTFNILIKPAFEELGYPCYRAIDKNINGSIDKLMLREIKHAYIVIADISTLNANVMWELGVRHALKPHHTIMICEKAQMGAIPFDINSFVIHQYTHSEEGIPYIEVERFRKYLKATVTQMINANPPLNDSPVFTFLQDELLKSGLSERGAMEAMDAGVNVESFASLMEQAEKSEDLREFEKAISFLNVAEKIAEANMSLKDTMPSIVARKALCTYKGGQPNEFEALLNAKNILDQLKPAQSLDPEVLGLNGAINKRLFELTRENEFLDKAIDSYERGFQLKQDYFNGINTAFMLYKKASRIKTENGEWEDIKLKADYIRNSVLEIALRLEREMLPKADLDDPDGRKKAQDLVWVLYTIAEAYHYRKNEVKQKEYEGKAADLATQLKIDFAPSSYEEQKNKIAVIMQSFW